MSARFTTRQARDGRQSVKPSGLNARRSKTSQRIDLGALLEAFVQSRNYVPAGARRIRAQEDLPLALRTHVKRSDGEVWRAWGTRGHIWFVKAKPLSWESAAALHMMFFDVDGHVASSKIWSWGLSEPAAVM